MSDSNNFFSNSYDSSSYNKPTEYFEVLDKWFASDMYTTVENDAFLGCGNSVEFLKEFEMHLDGESSKKLYRIILCTHLNTNPK